MKNILTILLLFSLSASAQVSGKIKFPGVNGAEYSVTFWNAADTNAVPSRYVLNRKIDSLSAIISTKGTSSFNGDYSSLSGKPALFSGSYTDLTNKPTLFDGAWASLSGKPTTFTPSSHTHVIADISDFGSYAASNHTHTFTSLTSKPTTLSGYGITDAVANTITVNSQALSGNVTITTVSGNAGTATALQNARTINGVSFDGTTNIIAPIPVAAQVNLTAQAANIGTTTLYAVPSAGFYRVSIYITVTQAATTSSTMPSTTISYTDGNSGTNTHSTTTTATNASNSVTTSFAQTTYVLYAKASTNIQYATGSYASSGGTPMQYALRIRVEQL